MERTDAPADLDLTIAGPADPIDALQVEPQDADAPLPPDAAQSEADTPFELVEDEHTPIKFVGDPIAAILKSKDAEAENQVAPKTPVDADAPCHPERSEGSTRPVRALRPASAPVPMESDPTPQGSACVAQDDVVLSEEIDAESDGVVCSPGRTGAWWTLPLVFAGIGIVACALLVPAADENRRAMHELQKINRDVTYFERQSEVNKEFLERVSSDPTLAERLAMRQLRLTRPDAKIANLPPHHDKYGMSPFGLVSIDPPPAVPAYQPAGGFLGRWFLDMHRQIYFCGAGLLMIATGLICGGGQPATRKGPEVQPA